MLLEFYILGMFIPALIVIGSVTWVNRFNSMFVIPCIVFGASILLAIATANFTNAGISGLIGWGVFYTLLSLIAAFLMRFVSKKVVQ